MKACRSDSINEFTPIYQLGELILPSYRWSTSISSDFRVVIEYIPRDSVGWHS
jgi:hypothetical protein